MFFMHRFRHHRHHHHCDRHQDNMGRTDGFPGQGRHEDRIELLLDRAAARLDLTSQQQALLAELLAQLNRQRSAIKALSRGPELAQLLAGDNFRRQAAQQLLDSGLDALRAAGPELVAAFGNFFDALDFEQQQALRFVLRRRRGGRAAS